jgi:TRAP-type C4-dicarboxylate transport system permease small subunit
MARIRIARGWVMLALFIAGAFAAFIILWATWEIANARFG